MYKVGRLVLLVSIALAGVLPEVQAQGTVSAPGGVAAGGDIRGSTINIVGIPPEQVAVITEALKREQKLTDEQRQVISDLEGKLGVSAGALRTFFRTLGEAEVPPERQEARLLEIAERYRQLLTELEAAPGDDPEIAKLKAEAKAALDAGDLERADAMLARVQTAQDAAVDRQQLEAAATAAQRGQIALTRLRYREAADHFAAAARRVPPGHEEQAWDYLSREAAALYMQGDEFGDNPALAAAVDRYRQLLRLLARDRVPLDWAVTQNNLGTALSALGRRESGTARLEEAVEAYWAALQELTRARVPLDWAMTQNNLGTALSALGEREAGTQRLEEAVSAYRNALEERTRERVPLQWATTQNNLGLGLWRLGERESGTERLEEAVEAFRAALEERTRERVPLDWAATQNNLGGALARLGERESGTQRLEEAVAAYRAALQELTRERVPLRWAVTQNGLGFALLRLGERESGTQRLEEAVEAFRAALQELTRARVPLDWAMTQNNLGLALLRLGERESGTQRLEEAVQAFRATLEERTRERVPLDWAKTQTGLGLALTMLGERQGQTERLREASAIFSSVLQVNPDDEGAYAMAHWLYHERLFAFAEAFDLSKAWLERHPENFGAQANFAEAAFTFSRFAEAEQRLAALLDRPKLEATAVPLCALEICNLVALNRLDTLGAKLNALDDLLKSDELRRLLSRGQTVGATV